jgi:hypothetical protein
MEALTMNLPERPDFAHAVCSTLKVNKLIFSILLLSVGSDLCTLTTVKLASAFLMASSQNKLGEFHEDY